MANHYEPSAEEQADWLAWVGERPPLVREEIRARGFTPWKLYLLKSSGHRVTIYGYGLTKAMPPAVHLQVDVLGRFNLVEFERRVFGIATDDLEECDLPSPGEALGVTLTAEQQLELQQHMQARHRAQRKRH